MLMGECFTTEAIPAGPMHAFSFAKAAQGWALKGRGGGDAVGEGSQFFVIFFRYRGKP
jgi:hypothetical protein